MRDDLETWLSTRELLPGASVTQLMQRLFGKEMREQQHQIAALLNSQPDLSSEGGVTMVAPLLGTAATLTGLQGTQVSSVTDLMDELTRQRRATTRLLGGLLLLVACAFAFGIYWTLVLRPAQTQVVATTVGLPAAPKAAAATAATAASVAPAAAPRSTAEIAAVAASPNAGKSPKGAQATHLQARVGKHADALETAWLPLPAPAPAPVAAETGLLNLDTNPWSTVSVGGRVLGTTPLVGASLPVGTHTLVLSNPELGLKTMYQVTIAAGKTTARRVGLE
jgi:hypothetical protein